MNKNIKEMLKINSRQSEYYEKASGSAKSPLNSKATNIWRHIRMNALGVFKDVDIQKSLMEMHLQWLGNISNAKVLDLGVGEGNPLSLKFAKEAREYVAIDLSSTRIQAFRTKLNQAGIKGARTYVADFLSDDFPEEEFDIVYALAIIHHFKHIEDFLTILDHRMANGGVVITQDPLQTWIPIKLFRLAYRPFQTDASWEFPFTRNSLDTIQRKFLIERVQGIYGYSKWAIPISIFTPKFARRYAQLWHYKDLRHATKLNTIMSCLRASFMLRKR